MKNRGRGVLAIYPLHRFEAGLACLLGVRLADPHHAAPHGAKWVLVQDQFNRLPTPQPEIPVQPEPAVRRDASTTRQGILVWFRSRLVTRLARFFAAIRLRFLGWRGFLASGGGGGWLAGLFCEGGWIWG